MIRDVNNIKIAVICKDEQIPEIEGADFVGSLDLIEKIRNGWLDFDILMITPEMMPKVGPLGKKILGPAGLMPNVYAHTIGGPNQINLYIALAKYYQDSEKDLKQLEEERMSWRDALYFHPELQTGYTRYRFWLLDEIVQSLHNAEFSIN